MGISLRIAPPINYDSPLIHNPDGVGSHPDGVGSHRRQFRIESLRAAARGSSGATPPPSLDLQGTHTCPLLLPPPSLHLQLPPDLGSRHRFPCFASELEVEQAAHHLPRSRRLRVSSLASKVRSSLFPLFFFANQLFSVSIFWHSILEL
jgi:hypothetical protein